MKKLAISILLMVIMAAGCAGGLVNTVLPPLAYIDSVSASEIVEGDTLKLAGHAVASSGEIVAYNWRSSINGDLSREASFETYLLSAGAHTIWFKAQDKYGTWSNEIGTNVFVRTRGGVTLMQIREFSADPINVRQGQWTTLSWDVAGSGSVSIDPEIGAVAYTGSRSVKPMKDTVYTIYATNEAGKATATTKVLVTTLPVTTLMLYSVAAEDGTVRKDKITQERVYVGENDLQIQMQGFLSYDISNIPPGAVITDAQLDLTATNVVGAPFPYQGSMNVYGYQYGSILKSNHYMNIVPAGFLYSWSYNSTSNMVPDRVFTSQDMVNAVQRQVDAGSERFQLRLQFEKYYYYPKENYKYANTVYPDAETSNYLDITAGNPSMTIKYVVPE